MTDQLLRNAAFAKLGTFLREFCEYSNGRTETLEKTNPWFSKLEEGIVSAGRENGWYTKENILFALQVWGNLLTETSLTHWLSSYDLRKNSKKTVALIMAGNIPLVGFHDFLSVLLTGNKALIKLSDSDRVLLPIICDFLIESASFMGEDIEFVDGKLKDFDAVIATGSNNTARYFEYYFGSKPHIIRKNRNSVAVLTGDESEAQLHALGNDIFQYYGLGCRSISKLFVPEGYIFDAFFEAIDTFKGIVEHRKYANNYDYNKAVYLMSDFKILDNGFLILKEDAGYSSPIASLNYGSYSMADELRAQFISDKDELQCIVSCGFIENEVNFGETQTPNIDDYADGIDTVDFLLRT
jgi:hypothetical protein